VSSNWRRSDSTHRAVALLGALISAALLVAAAVRSDGWAFSWVGFPLVSGVILKSRPRNLTGWLLLAVGLAITTSLLPTAFGIEGAYPTLEWLDWVSLTVPILLGTLLLTFPRGELPSPRWRFGLVVAWVATTGLVAVMAVAKPDLIVDLDVIIDNPGHVPALEGFATLEPVFTGLIAGFILAVVVNLVVRFLRSQRLERQQFRWLAFVAVVAPVLLLIGAGSPSNVVTVVAFVLALNLIPSAIGVAVLRYRLYDIERLISRTVSYTMVIVVLAGVFLAVVSILGSLVPADSSLAVAGSTLLVAALFNPLRRLALDRVDRWFNRTRYEAQQVVDRFALSIRDEAEIEPLSDGLGHVVVRTLQPASFGIWIADDS